MKIVTYNCRGINDSKKRADIFDFLKRNDADIYCLQDVHFTANMQKRIYSQWNAECHFSFASSNARGVAIFFKRNLDFKVHQKFSDTNGNYIILDLTLNSKRFTLCNIYGPNTDKPEFYEHIFQLIDNIGNDSYICCGDFNLVLDTDLDYYNYKSIDNNKKARNLLIQYIENQHLCDPFRECNGDIRQYTWRRTSPTQQARLDFFLITEDFLPQVRNCNIGSSYRSDHSMVILNLNLTNVSHGKGLWKFNNSLLYDLEYLKIINEKIEEVKKQYCLPVYNINNIQNISNNELIFVINDQLFLETLLMEIRGKTISYSSYKKKKRKSREDDLISEINDLEKKLHEKDKLLNLQKELENIRQEKIKGNFIRSRAEWIDNGEIPSKLFCNLEKYNYNSKIIPFLKEVMVH